LCFTVTDFFLEDIEIIDKASVEAVVKTFLSHRDYQEMSKHVGQTRAGALEHFHVIDAFGGIPRLHFDRQRNQFSGAG
jgi:hypothetical protein